MKWGGKGQKQTEQKKAEDQITLSDAEVGGEDFNIITEQMYIAVKQKQ